MMMMMMMSMTFINIIVNPEPNIIARILLASLTISTDHLIIISTTFG